MKFAEINFLDIEESQDYENIINIVIEKCFHEEKIDKKNLYINIILTNPENIKKLNNNYRKINKETDVLSFPMFERKELENFQDNKVKDILGDMVISIERVREQANEYEHSFTREFAYMIVHGFYHLMGYDHMNEQEKKEMRKKEENILEKLDIIR